MAAIVAVAVAIAVAVAATIQLKLFPSVAGHFDWLSGSTYAGVELGDLVAVFFDRVVVDAGHFVEMEELSAVTSASFLSGGA